MKKLFLDLNKIKGISWFVLSLIIGITNDAIVKFLCKTIPIYNIVFLRFLFGTLALIPFILLKGKSFKTSRILLHIIRGGLLFLATGSWCMGLTTGKLAVATTITFTIPIFVLILAIKFLNEKLNKIKIWATIVGFIGIVVVVNPTSDSFNITSTMLVIGSFFFASLDIINKKFSQVESIPPMLFYSNLFATLSSSILITDNLMSLVSIKTFLLLFLLGAGSNLMLYCLLKSFSYMEVSSVSPYRYLELIFSVVIGYIFFEERFGVVNWLGAILIILSTFIMLSFDTITTSPITKNTDMENRQFN
ncbi:MAG: DMT family transporter [Rickettsiales bacterium]|nr:DMT family transporter [Rickettsiales bacterium]